ncbi:hypothetical protein GCM10009117_12210 [Gangjinia marincola]|uniref:Toxin-antitoxin system YwqK family antitoxin n=1 Tax=Gangjinia marincola TaxID=578463 RepID=A0ABP3XRP4_9FLAO
MIKNVNLVILFIALFCSLATSSAQDIIFDENETYYSNGQLKERCDNRYDGERSGTCKTYYKDGTLKSLGVYKKGKKDGAWKTYHSNGELKEEGSYTAGKLWGEWKIFHDNGTLFQKATYNDMGYLEGKLERYHKSGKKAEIGEAKGSGVYQWIESYDTKGRLIDENNLNFEWITYKDDGTIYRSGFYKNGKEHGKWSHFDDDGVLTFFSLKEQGATISLTSFYNNGSLKREVTYKDELPYDEIKYSKDNGKIIYTKKHEKNRLIEKHFYKDGQLERLKIYVNGKKQDKWMSYYCNGEVSKQESYDDGQPEGEWLQFDRKGNRTYKAIIKDNVVKVYDEKNQIIETSNLRGQ